SFFRAIANNQFIVCWLYVGGDFTTIDGQVRNRLAAIEASSGALTTWNPNVDGSVYTLAASGSTVYVGGGFITIGSQTRNNIAAIDASSGTPNAWNPSPSNLVSKLAVSGSTVYVGGNFAIFDDLRSSFFAISPMDLTP
uniref:hypothetical protein n=1 Tax=uncultured Legionella sp. TaxID=210934 RepID=UPI00261640C5